MKWIKYSHPGSYCGDSAYNMFCKSLFCCLLHHSDDDKDDDDDGDDVVGEEAATELNIFFFHILYVELY